MYKIGTRVKFFPPEGDRNPNNGITGIVVPSSCTRETRVPLGCDIVVRADQSTYCYRTRSRLPAGTAKWTRSRYWKPIIPDGHKPAKWEDCEWQPEKETADASA